MDATQQVDSIEETDIEAEPEAKLESMFSLFYQFTESFQAAAKAERNLCKANDNLNSDSNSLGKRLGPNQRRLWSRTGQYSVGREHFILTTDEDCNVTVETLEYAE